MVKEIWGSIGDFDQMTIIPGWTSPDSTYDKVDLSVELAPDVILTYPIVAAAMTSVVDEKLMFECARNGIMAVAPTGRQINEAAGMVGKVKDQKLRRGDLEIVRDPVMISADGTVSDGIQCYHKAGHSEIPICDGYRELRGMFRYREGIPPEATRIAFKDALKMPAGPENPLDGVVKPFSVQNARPGTDYCGSDDDSKQIHAKLRQSGNRCMPLLDDRGVLRGLAFEYKHHGYAVGGAIHTYNWQERADALVGAGADIIFIDASQGATDFQVNTIREFKRRHPNVPIFAGNVVSSRALRRSAGGITEVDVYRELTEAGADGIKIGMGSGRSCVTTDNRGVGRRLLRALDDLYKARAASSCRHVPFIADGGIGTFDPNPDKRALVREGMRHDMRSFDLSQVYADASMAGAFFGMLEEAAAPYEDRGGKRFNQHWGEGSYKAQSLVRYGIHEGVKRAHAEEGLYRLIPCVGCLKPAIEWVALNMSLTLANVGARNLKEYREMTILEGP